MTPSIWLGTMKRRHPRPCAGTDGSGSIRYLIAESLNRRGGGAVSVVIKGVEPGSPAARKGIRPGDVLETINKNCIRDVLDYRFR